MAAGLEMLQRVRRETGLPVLTDVHETHQVAPVAQVVDVLQIPAFLSRQTDLLVAAAGSGRLVNLKKGQMLSADTMVRPDVCSLFGVLSLMDDGWVYSCSRPRRSPSRKATTVTPSMIVAGKKWRG